jgi:hypothetical protein
MAGAVDLSGDMELLRQQLIQAELELQRERTQRVASDAARDAADAARAAADAARAAAEAEAHRERTQRIAAEEDSRKQRAATFFAALRGMSGSASEHAAVSSDVSRRGAPAPEIVSAEAFFHGLPAVQEADVQAAWDVCRGQLAARPAVSASDLGTLAERTFVHPLVWLLLEVAQQPEGEARVLRLWREACAEDSVPHGGAEPDLLCTHVRDASPCSLGACFSLEVKRWVADQLDVGCAQAGNYSRRLLARQAMELLERGAPLSDLAVLAAASNGMDIVFLRVRSGVCADGPDPFCGTPCPTEQSPPLPLLRAWDPARPTEVPRTPPVGFAALVRVLRMPPALLNACTLPLERVMLTVPGLVSGELRLGARLGCGGSSDVYACVLPDDVAAVVKLARAATRRTNQMLDAETSSLRALHAAPADAVPQLLGAGTRELPARAQLLVPNLDAAPWQLLILSPAGMPLSAALAKHLQRQASQDPVAPGDDPLSARRAFGDVVAAGVLRGLHAAHAVRIIHCDVRPSNVVFLEAETRPGAVPVVAGTGAALLVDYGLSRAPGDNARGVGVRAYAADCVFSQSSCTARAGLDLVATAYTWLSIVHGDAACRAPWSATGETAAAWVAREAANDVHVARIAAAVAVLVRPSGGTPMVERWYQWPWPGAPDA